MINELSIPMTVLATSLLVVTQSLPNGEAFGGGVAGLITGAGISGYVLWHLLNKTLPKQLESIDKIVTEFRDETKEQRNSFSSETQLLREFHHQEINKFWSELKIVHNQQQTESQNLRQSLNELSNTIKKVNNDSERTNL